MLTKSAWKWRLTSWNGLRLNCEVGTLAVIASIAEELVSAQASGMMMLQEPGPHEVKRRHRLVLHAEIGVGHVRGDLLVPR